MSSIDSIQQLVSTLRQEMVGRLAARFARGMETVKAARLARPAVAQGRRLEELIARRVENIDPDDSEKGRKAFRIFLELTLLHEFGEDLINDPAFYQLVDKVQESMEQQPGLQGAVQRAIANLVEPTATRD